MKVTVKGQVTIPKSLRDRYGLSPGTEVRFVERDHRVVVEKARAADVWQRYRGVLQLRTRTEQLLRLLRGPRP